MDLTAGQRQALLDRKEKAEKILEITQIKLNTLRFVFYDLEKEQDFHKLNRYYAGMILFHPAKHNIIVFSQWLKNQ